jgi:ParB-like chromosome segregation protein Spo0J
MSTLVNPKELVQRAPFSDLFDVDQDVMSELVADMQVNKFDKERPVFAWRSDEGLVLVDGHMRVKAAIQARITEVPVVVRWKGKGKETEAFLFAIASQRVRRNLSKEELAERISDAELRRRGEEPRLPAKKAGEPTVRKPGRQADPVKAAVVEQAKAVGISKRTAEAGLAKARAKAKAPKSKAEQARALRGGKTGKALEPLRSALLIGLSNGRRFYWPRSLYKSMDEATEAAQAAGVLASNAGLAFTQYRAKGEFASLVEAIEQAGAPTPVLPSQAGPSINDVVVLRDAAVASAKFAADLVSKAAKGDAKVEAAAQAQAEDAARLWGEVAKAIGKRLGD